MNIKRSNAKDEVISPLKESERVPSGFVLKLYQMVNGAPDEIISWLPSGDAFRISDLERLENETLPTFFRHRRFQSLVRQLNFYNFRKVNRERTFWVYRHNLFHRDRPEELHLLRRRTCPGVDGRKQRPDLDIRSLEAGVRSNSPRRIDEDQSDDSVVGSSVGTTPPNRRTKKHRKVKVVNNIIPEDVSNPSLLGVVDSRAKRGVNFIRPSDASDLDVNSSMGILSHLKDDTSIDSSLIDRKKLSDANSAAVFEKRNSVSSGDEDDEPHDSKRRRLERSEQELLVTKVARQLDEHAKRAFAQKGVKGRRVGTVTPPFSSDTMKYHALTYDDEIEMYKSEESDDGVYTNISRRSLGYVVVTDGDDSDDEYYTKHVETANLLGIQSVTAEQQPARKPLEKFTSPPVSDTFVISTVAQKFRLCVESGLKKDDCILAAAVAQFCMSTAPQDPLLGKKAVELMTGCERLAQEFRLYKAALSPNSAPTELLSLKGKDQYVVKQLFEKDTDMDTIRVFKAFVLNCLDDLVGDTNLTKTTQLSEVESQFLNQCVKVWFAGVVASS